MESQIRKWTVVLLLLSSCAGRPALRSSVSTIHAYFTTDDPGGPERAIVDAVNAARGQILVEAYYLTSTRICAALNSVRIHHNVQVKILKDQTDQGECIQKFDRGHRIYPRNVSNVKIAHNKVMIIDSIVVITGSYNFTEDAKHNAENLLVIEDRSLALEYAQKWWELYDESTAD